MKRAEFRDTWQATHSRESGGTRGGRVVPLCDTQRVYALKRRGFEAVSIVTIPPDQFDANHTFSED